jgi:hypothetical protein
MITFHDTFHRSNTVNSRIRRCLHDNRQIWQRTQIGKNWNEQDKLTRNNEELPRSRYRNKKTQHERRQSMFTRWSTRERPKTRTTKSRDAQLEKTYPKSVRLRVDQPASCMVVHELVCPDCPWSADQYKECQRQLLNENNNEKLIRSSACAARRLTVYYYQQGLRIIIDKFIPI